MKVRLKNQAGQVSASPIQPPGLPSGPEPPHLPQTLTFTSFARQILTFPLPAGPITSWAYRGMVAPPVPDASSRTDLEFDHHAPFSLRATPTKFREHDVETNRNPNSLASSVLPRLRLRSVLKAKSQEKRVLPKVPGYFARAQKQLAELNRWDSGKVWLPWW